MGGRDNIFDAQGIFFQELYTRLTLIEAWTFAKPLLAEISTEIADLKATVDTIAPTMQDALRRVSTGIDECLKKAIRFRVTSNSSGLIADARRVAKVTS